MATSTASSMSSMATSTSMVMSMHSMDMVFFTSTSTPLWSSAFTPNTTGKYAGACIFLIVLTVIFRALMTFRLNFFNIMAALNQRWSGGLLRPSVAETKVETRPLRADEAVMVGVHGNCWSGLFTVSIDIPTAFCDGYD